MQANKLKPASSPKTQFRIGFLVHDVSRMRRTLFDQAMKPRNLTRAQWWLLASLSRHPERGMTQTELGRVMDVGKATVGGLIDRLEETGHVQRKSDSVDRRVNRVSITERGHRVLDEMSSVARLLNVQILRGVDDSEQRMFEDVLHRIKANLREALDGIADEGRDES